MTSEILKSPHKQRAGHAANKERILQVVMRQTTVVQPAIIREVTGLSLSLVRTCLQELVNEGKVIRPTDSRMSGYLLKR
jgi:ribosomal protein S25